jgi:hypothetical protein
MKPIWPISLPTYLPLTYLTYITQDIMFDSMNAKVNVAFCPKGFSSPLGKVTYMQIMTA